MKDDNNVHALATYVSDMLALERHVRVPFETQAKDDDFHRYGPSAQIVQRLMTTSGRHIDVLDGCLETLGGHEASPVKSSVTQMAGLFAGAIDKMRKTKASKGLRDSYTALALCTAGYSALLATANALGNAEVARIAETLLQDYAQLVMEIGEALPLVVVQELQEDTDLDVDPATAEQSRERITSAWRGGAQSERGVTTTTTGVVDDLRSPAPSGLE